MTTTNTTSKPNKIIWDGKVPCNVLKQNDFTLSKTVTLGNKTHLTLSTKFKMQQLNHTKLKSNKIDNFVFVITKSYKCCHYSYVLNVLNGI